MGPKEEYERRKREKYRRKHYIKALLRTGRDPIKVFLGNFGKNTFRHPERVTRFIFYVAVFTGLLLITAFIQTWAFIQSERAFISIEDIRFPVGALTANKQFVLFFNVKNSGKSAATIIDLDANFATGGMAYSSRPTKIGGPDEIPAGESLPHKFMAVDENNKPMTPTAEDVASVMNGTDTLYFVGVITYEDDFWWRATSFCFAYMPEASPSSMAAFGACPTGGTPLLK